MSKAQKANGISPIRDGPRTGRRRAIGTPAASGSTTTDLIDCIREIIERHRVNDATTATGHLCQCGSEELSDHSRHVAQEVIARLGLRPERAVYVKDEIRYVSAWFDDELTKLQGAE